jgi:hypothetical protein
MHRNYVGAGTSAAAAVLSCGAIVARAPVVVTAILGTLLFGSVGYVWVEVLFARRLAGLERIAVATGLALSAPIIGGLGLYAAGVPLHRAAWVYLLAAATLVGDAVLVARRPAPRPTATEKRPRIQFRLGWQAAIYGAAIVVAGCAVALASAGAVTQHYPGFTQFWLYTHGNAGVANLGVDNQQGETKQYRVILLRRGRPSGSWNITLSNGQVWRRNFAVSGAQITAANLYMLPDLTHPYRHVSILS